MKIGMCLFLQFVFTKYIATLFLWIRSEEIIDKECCFQTMVDR